MISDNWHTDIIVSLQGGLEMVLVFLRVTWPDNIEPYSYTARSTPSSWAPRSCRRAALAEPLPGAKRTMLRDQRQHLASDSTPSPIIVTVVWGREHVARRPPGGMKGGANCSRAARP